MIKQLPRVFFYDNKEIPEPNQSFDEIESIKFLSGTYPELINAKVEKREIKNDKLVVVLSINAGTKG